MSSIDYYFDAAQGSCIDYRTDVNIGSSYRTVYLRAQTELGGSLAADAIPLQSWMLGDTWHETPTSSYISMYGAYAASGFTCPAAGAALPFRIMADGNFDRYFYFRQQPPNPQQAHNWLCLVMFDVDVAPVGGSITVTVHVRDVLNRFKTSGGDPLTIAPASYADADLSVSAVTDHGDGTYSAVVTKPTAGSCYLDIQLGGVRLEGQVATARFSDSAVVNPAYYTVPDAIAFDPAAGVLTLHLLDSAGNPGNDPYNQAEGLRMFADGGIVIGGPTRVAAGQYAFPVTLPSGYSGEARVWCYLNGRVMGKVWRVQMSAGQQAAVTSRQIGLRARVNGPVPARDIGVRAIVNDVGNVNSFPAPGGANQSYPRYSSWTIR